MGELITPPKHNVSMEIKNKKRKKDKMKYIVHFENHFEIIEADCKQDAINKTDPSLNIEEIHEYEGGGGWENGTEEGTI